MIPISKPYIGETEKNLVQQVLDSGYLVQGPRVKQLEELFAIVCGVDHAVAVSNGTVALYMALVAHGVGAGDEVITTSFTFIATVNAILMAGAKPVFVDIEEDSFNMDVSQIESAITPQTKAIMPVHLYGLMCDMDLIETIADKHGLALFEDAAQAVGATHKGRKAGSIGTGCFSLYATKNVMSAEGGMITTNSAEIAERCRLFRSHGMKKRYHYESLGFNFRLSDLHAAIGVAQMGRLADFTEKRQANAEYLNAHIKAVKTPRVPADYTHVWHQFTVQVKGDRDKVVEQLNNAGIGTGIFYPFPCHQQSYVQDVVGEVSLPVTERVAKQVFSLPVHPQLSQADLEKIATEVNKL